MNEDTDLKGSAANLSRFLTSKRLNAALRDVAQLAQLEVQRSRDAQSHSCSGTHASIVSFNSVGSPHDAEPEDILGLVVDTCQRCGRA